MAAPARANATPAVRAGSALSLAGVIVAACSGDDQQATTTTSTVAPTTTTISPARPNDGVLVDRRLPPANRPGAALGGPMITAVDEAVDQINSAGGVLGRNVELEVVDESAGTGLDELLAAGVDAIVGPASSTVALSQLRRRVHAGHRRRDVLAVGDGAWRSTTTPTTSSSSAPCRATRCRWRRSSVGSSAPASRPSPSAISTTRTGAASSRRVRRRGRRRATELELQANVGFDADQEDLDDVAEQLLAGGPGVIVVLGDADDGTRLLAGARCRHQPGVTPPLVIVNDAIRDGRQAIQALSPEFRASAQRRRRRCRPRSTADGPEGFFAANAVDCVNLIALAAIQAGSDDSGRDPEEHGVGQRRRQPCMTFADCASNARRRPAASTTAACPATSSCRRPPATSCAASFEAFGFDDEGVDHPLEGSPLRSPRAALALQQRTCRSASGDRQAQRRDSEATEQLLRPSPV